MQARAASTAREILERRPDLHLRGRLGELADLVAAAMMEEEGWENMEAATRRCYDYLVQAKLRDPKGKMTPIAKPDHSVDMAPIWDQAMVLNQRAIANGEAMGKATIRVDEEMPFGILFSSDEHLDDTGTDLQWLQDMAALVAKTDGLYAGLHGDLRNNFIIPQLLSTILKSEYKPETQMLFVEHFLKMFGGKILYLVAGNHDKWEASKTGIDSLGKLARGMELIYDTDELTLDLKCEGVTYTVFVRHKGRFNSSYNATHGPKQWLRMGLAPHRSDIVMGGHYHLPDLEEFLWNGLWRMAIQTGSAKVVDDFPRTIGVPPGGPMAPVVIFNPQHRSMTPFRSHHAGAAYLNYLRGNDAGEN